MTPELLALGVSFYDAMREHGAADRDARHAAVMYMRRKDEATGDAMPYYERLAAALADRAAQRLKDAGSLAFIPPEGGRQ